MIRICLVEDEDSCVDTFKKYINSFKAVVNKKFSVSCFKNSYDMALNFKPLYDVIFLGIKGNSFDGIAKAKAIRKSDKYVPIILVADNAELALEGYKVGALDYLIKPCSYNLFFQTMMRVIDLINQKPKSFLLLRRENALVKVNEDKIVYVESKEHLITVHTEETVFQLYSSLIEIENKLISTTFVRCNSCYLVNLKYVEEERDNIAYLMGNIQLKISKFKKKNFMQKWKDYV